MAAPLGDPAQGRNHRLLFHDLLHQKAGAADSPADPRHDSVDSSAYLSAEPSWRLDHEIKEQAPAAGCQLRFLCLQFLHCRGHTQPGLRADMGPPIEDAVDSCCAKASLPGDLLYWKAMGHLMCF